MYVSMMMITIHRREMEDPSHFPEDCTLWLLVSSLVVPTPCPTLAGSQTEEYQHSSIACYAMLILYFFFIIFYPGNFSWNQDLYAWRQHHPNNPNRFVRNGHVDPRYPDLDLDHGA